MYNGQSGGNARLGPVQSRLLERCVSVVLSPPVVRVLDLHPRFRVLSILV